ncbi:MAG: enterochelin esterase [Caulobacteraceae bacterium]|nr:enterochelin esterase [Caulobacter sp.]
MRRLPSLFAALSLLACAPAQAAPVVFRVGVAPQAAGAPASGRLLIFAEPLAQAKADAKGQPIEAVEVSPFHPGEAAVAAQEVADLAPGATVDVDADTQAFPQAFSHLKPGRYAVQAVLDRDHVYNYSGRTAGMLLSPVTEIDLPAGGALTLDHAIPASDPTAPSPKAPEAQKAAYPLARADIRPVDFESPALTAFWGRSMHIKGWVLLPPGYAASSQRYPVAYWTNGFGGTLAYAYDTAVGRWRDMHDGAMPPMIWVFLDEGSPTGTHEFADSVNNGPWGQALTTELIPELERTYRMDARPSGRFLTGHSSGGWATLWLQVRYPRVFGGTWSTSPDPSDFHDWTGVDIYAPHANVYHRPDGSPAPLIRDHAKVLGTLENFTKLEVVLGPTGGQQSSFDWVFSPRGPQGAPLVMFDRTTGDVDPAVVAYWRDHWDIAARLQRDWPMLKPDLDGKVHVIVGTADTFYLDGSARLLKGVMDGLGARASFRFLPDRTHFDLYRIGDDKHGLEKTIAWEMYAVARPGAARPASVPQPQVGP